MHQSSIDNMKLMLDKISLFDHNDEITVVDYGGRKVENQNNYYSLFRTNDNIKYIGVDICEGEGVDIVLSDPYKSPLDDNSIDIVITGQMFEHCEFFWLTILDMARIIKPGGYILAVTPSGGPVHRYPVDCWRFYPDSYAALCKWAKLDLVESWHTPIGKWSDMVGIMRKPL